MEIAAISPILTLVGGEIAVDRRAEAGSA
jgi:hypothetical protein